MTSRLANLHEAIGYMAGLLATAAFLPQTFKTIKTRHTRDISLGMYILFCLGVTLWLAYGFLISSWPVIISNFFTLLLSGTILVLKIRNG